jgi:hypothetical protein
VGDDEEVERGERTGVGGTTRIGVESHGEVEEEEENDGAEDRV